MKRLIGAVLCSLLLLTGAAYASDVDAVDSSRFTGVTKSEALIYIEEAMKDPEIHAWTQNKFGSDSVFITGLKVSSEQTALEVATILSDYQQVGGDLDTAMEAYMWVALIGSVVLLVLLL